MCVCACGYVRRCVCEGVCVCVCVCVCICEPVTVLYGIVCFIYILVNL